METRDKIKELESELSKTKYNKATEHHFAIVKAKIAKLRDRLETKEKSKSGGAGFAVSRTGDATVILLGFPSVGKSTILNKLTNAQSRTAAYAFTTLTVIPGVLEYNQAKIQILDVPGVIQGASAGKGRGKEVLSMVRNSDLILMIIDAQHPEHYHALLGELHHTNVRVNQEKPDVKIVKKIRGGLDIQSTVRLTKLNKETIQSMFRELGINNADVVLREDIDADQLIDIVEGNRKYIPSVVVVSKADLINEEQKNKIFTELKPDLFLSAEKNKGINELKKIIYDRLQLIRIYLKEINKQPDLEEPMILRNNSTIRDICQRIHRDFIDKFKFARIWGPSAKFPGQIIRTIDKKLTDKDILEIHTR